MKTSTERILTTHTGSLPRPAGLPTDGTASESAVHEAVAQVVRSQLDAHVDVINDGEASKPSYATYVTTRLTGFGGTGVPPAPADLADFPEFAERLFGDPDLASSLMNPACIGPVTYEDRVPLQRDIENLTAATKGSSATEVFMSAASPGVITVFMANQYYPSEEEYLAALADAMKEEYDAIHQAGFVLQLDCPDLAMGAHMAEGGTDENRRRAQRVEAINHATRDIPPDRMRMHLCWGNYEGPHHRDVPLADILGEVLRARPSAISFEGANPRHEHEWTVFEDHKLPDGKVLIPGVIDSTTNYIEHPDLVAQRLRHYTGLVGQPNVMAGSDCGFATFASFLSVDPKITWAKLSAMAEGARRASA